MESPDDVAIDDTFDRIFAEEGPKLWRAVLAFAQDPTLWPPFTTLTDLHGRVLMDG
jgi:hypothetical protein